MSDRCVDDCPESCPRHARAVLCYFAIAFGGSWALAGAFWLLGGRLTGDLLSAAVGVPYMMFPLVGAIVAQRFVKRQPLAGPLGINFRPNWWWLLAWLGPLAVTLGTLGVSLLLPGVRFSTEMAGLFERFAGLVPPDRIAETRAAMARLPVHPFWLLLGQGLVAGVTVNTIAGFGEELGWRGFLQNEYGRLGFWRSSLLVGLVWGVWHAPLVLQGLNYRQHPVAGVGMMVAWCLLLAPLFNFIRLKARSVVAAAVMHGSLNAFAGLALVMVSGGGDLLVGVPGLAGFIVLGLLNLALLVFGRRALAAGQ